MIATEHVVNQGDWAWRDDEEIEWEGGPESDDAIVLYAPLPVQEEPLAHPARFKLWRAGRRGSKTRGALYAAVMGHGPTMPDGEPLWKGLIHGVPILWLAPDIPQATAIWEEEILPRFEGKAGVTISKKHHVVKIGRGTLRIVSAENVDSIRGKKFAGFVGDEGAHFDLEYAWHKVVRPALADLRGWAIIPSTPNFGTDHPRNENRKHDQSYFNVLCWAEMKGELGERWKQFHWTMHDNPKIDPEELAEIEKEYENKPDSYDQEILAKLLEGIEGVFFREFSAKVHERKAIIPQQGVWWGGGMDWGYSSPGWFGLEAHWTGPWGRRKHLVMEFEFVKMPPYQAGYALGKRLLPHPVPEFISADSSMWDTGDGEGGKKVEPIADKFQRGLNEAMGRDMDGQFRAPLLVAAPKGSGSRKVRATAMREVLAHKVHPLPEDILQIPDGARLLANGFIMPWDEPILSIEPGACPHFIRCMETLPTDPKNPELPATQEVYDHPYDGETYLEVIRKGGEVEATVARPQARDENRSVADQKFKIRMEREDEREHSSRRRFVGRGRRD